MRPPSSVRCLLAMAALSVAAAPLPLDGAVAHLNSSSSSSSAKTGHAELCGDPSAMTAAGTMAEAEGGPTLRGEDALDHVVAEGTPTAASASSGPAAASASSSASPSSAGRTSAPFLFSRSYDIPPDFSYDLSTRDNYGEGSREFHGPFRDIRADLDFEYHGNYREARQAFQDRIVERLLERIEVTDAETGEVCKAPTEPWIVFTAGVMGAGKGHVMRQLSSRGLFPRKSFIVVDPDEIRSHFPEYHAYARVSPTEAGSRTHREAGYVAEIVAEAALRRGYNVLVDGSLWDHAWYREYFGGLRRRYPALRIAVLHVTAPREAVFERAARRAAETGRVVPAETLEHSLRQVPVSVKMLAPSADFFAELDNAAGAATMTTEGVTWDAFRDNWAQACPREPGGRTTSKM